MKLKKAIRTPKQTIPAGSELHFSNEGFGYYNGEKINIYGIPTHAIEMEDVTLVNNQLDPDNKWKGFDALEPGDTGFDVEGQPITILGKAVGSVGYDALVGQFGNTSPLSFEDITAGMDQTDIDAMQFVAYSDKDGAVFVDEYSNDTVTVTAGTEEDGTIKPFDDVKPTDMGVTKDGRVVTILASGQGRVWYEQTAEDNGIEPNFAPYEALLSEGESADTLNFVLCNDEANVSFIDVYGVSGVRVVAEEVTATEALQLVAMLRAAKRKKMLGKRNLRKR